MSSIEILIKCVILLFRELQLKREAGDSRDLVTNTLAILPKRTVDLIGNNDIEPTLRKTVSELLSVTEEEVDDTNILLSLKLCCGEDLSVYETVKMGIAKEMPESSIKKLVVNIRRNLNNYFKEVEISKILSTANYEFRHKRNSIKSVNEFIDKMVTNLEALELKRSIVDPAVIDDIDVGDDTALRQVMEKVVDNVSGKGMLKTGWLWLNTMIQGGFRRGEFTEILALQHNYKTGFSLSLFIQIALYNKPYLFNKNKKPLLLRISFEDDITSNIQFLYTYLKYIETKVPPNVTDVSEEEMGKYIKDKMSTTGFHIKMIRVDPTRWTYKHIQNKVLELEASGYEIQLLMMDYLGMIPTIGCSSTGGTGSDLRDLFRRTRNFCSEKKITVITPHQMSPDAKKLLRAGIPDYSFVKEIANKGYTSGSSQLDQEVDLELNIHIAKLNRKAYLTIQRGKHRVPSVVPQEDLYMILPFPKGMPILPDIDDDEPISKRDIKEFGEVELEF